MLAECEFTHSSESYHSPTVLLKINSCDFPALLDTGSQICAFSDLVWNSCLVGSDFPIFPITGVRVSGAFKNKCRKITHQVLLTFSMLNYTFQFEFFYIPDLVYPVILGADFLRTYRANLDLNAAELSLQVGNREIRMPETVFNHAFSPPTPPAMRAINVGGITPFHLPTVEGYIVSPKITNMVNNLNLTESQRDALTKLLRNHIRLFSDRPGLTTEYFHEIHLTEDKPFLQKPYSVPIAHRQAVEEQIKRMLDWGVIERCASSSYCSPLVTAVKKDGSVRVCLDARRLNSIMVPDSELPRPIEDILNTLPPKIKYMTSLDLTHSYWQIPLREQDKQYTCFIYHTKTYRFKVLPFGLKTAISSFTRAMDIILGSEFRDFVVCYVDDLLIVSESFEDHIEHLNKVLTRLSSAGFTLRLDKCHFLQSEMKFLGYILNSEGFKPDPGRVRAVLDFPVPQNRKQLHAFLGLCNYDRGFHEHFATLSEPLFYLLRKKVKWFWGSKQEESFNSLKQLISREILLQRPIYGVPFCVQTDASDVGLGAQLYQMVDGCRKTIAFASRLLLDRERSYSVSEKETLAVVWALNKWRVYLLGSRFYVYTDHRACSYLNTCRLLSPRITRWVLALQEYDYEIRYISGKENIVPDILSRAPVRLEYPSDKCFRILTFSLTLPDSLKYLLRNIATDQRDDPKLNRIIQDIADPNNMALETKFVLYKGVLFRRQNGDEPCLLCVPLSRVKEFISGFHEMIGHFGVYKTWSALRREVWWQNMHRDVKRVLKSCDLCQKTKATVHPKPMLQPILPEGTGDLWSIDFYGPLPRSRAGVVYLLVILDIFSKYTWLFPLKKANTRSVISCLREGVFKEFAPPRRILSDHGTQFTSLEWKTFCQSLNMQIIYCSVRHPQANPVERSMRELGRLFRAFCYSKQKRWAWELPKIREVLNSVVHESTGYSPWELQTGRCPPRLIPEILQLPDCESQQDAHVKIFLARESLLSRASKRVSRCKSRFNFNFAVGDLVLLKSNPVSSVLSSETKKLLLLYEGPYRIKRIVGLHTYILEYNDGRSERGQFHASHLKPYYYQ